jgi:hypothetical protein
VKAERAEARAADTPRSRLLALADHPEPVVRRALAANPAAPAAALERLARDPDDQVRVAVATNPAASATALGRLAGFVPDSGSGFAGVARRKALLAVVAHPAVPADVLARLAADADPLVARRAGARR